jgi:hypothetical protein
VRTAAARALVLLQGSSDTPLIPLVAVARRQGFAINEDLAMTTTTRSPLDGVIAVALGRSQLPNGRWRVGAPRVPVQESDIQTTALVIRVLLTFAPTHPDTAWRVERARAWLLTSAAVTAPDRAYRLLGLKWAGADHSDMKEATRALVREQGPDGAWAQLPGLNADAYATGLALVALREGGGMPPSHRAYQRGVAYLIRMQEDDGSWFVHSRAASINRYVERGFPHGMHQFSSFAGTAWATRALMHAAGQSALEEALHVAENQRCRAGLHGRIDGRHNQLSPVDW